MTPYHRRKILNEREGSAWDCACVTNITIHVLPLSPLCQHHHCHDQSTATCRPTSDVMRDVSAQTTLPGVSILRCFGVWKHAANSAKWAPISDTRKLSCLQTPTAAQKAHVHNGSGNGRRQFVTPFLRQRAGRCSLEWPPPSGRNEVSAVPLAWPWA